MMSPKGKLTALACHPTKKVNKAEELAYLTPEDLGRNRIRGIKMFFGGSRVKTPCLPIPPQHPQKNVVRMIDHDDKESHLLDFRRKKVL